MQNKNSKVTIATILNIVSSLILEASYFFVPPKTTTYEEDTTILEKNIVVLIPTYKPNKMTISLIRSILKWHPQVSIVIIDDNTPLSTETAKTLNEINWLAETQSNVHVIRSRTNTLKAGALNQGLAYLKLLSDKPDVIFTFDDDIAINQQTIFNMVHTLFEHEKIGAVCSQVRISNKNKNILTRIQALEYHNFNITKISDTGFLKGPLVMQGMLTAFRMDVLKKVGGFTVGHLIEDYDITARLKLKGWKAKIAQNAEAWTVVPETIPDLWKQRVRWTSGGLYVISSYWKSVPAVYQDLLGHALFLSLFTMIMVSFSHTDAYPKATALTLFVFGSALFSLFCMLLYNLASMLPYKDRDKKDWLIKAIIIPEFLYANFLTLILLGSYLYFTYNILARYLIACIRYLYQLGLLGFGKFGFSPVWGTR